MNGSSILAICPQHTRENFTPGMAEWTRAYMPVQFFPCTGYMLHQRICNTHQNGNSWPLLADFPSCPIITQMLAKVFDLLRPRSSQNCTPTYDNVRIYKHTPYMFRNVQCLGHCSVVASKTEAALAKRATALPTARRTYVITETSALPWTKSGPSTLAWT